MGLLVGNVISYILFALTPANWFLYGSPVFRLVFGLLLAFFHCRSGWFVWRQRGRGRRCQRLAR
ncbi:MAG: hypothetical protein IPJ94_27750 [Chloroflexi bacterium]|nr:hypothetical protein [Chloroflexota bacterium]